MCEHNMKIGDRLNLSKGHTACGACMEQNPDPPLGRDVIYVGDYIEGYHKFVFCTPFPCNGCGRKMTDTNLPCGAGNPIDVTQEFLSLPVRTK